MAQASEISDSPQRSIIATATPPPIDLNTINDSIKNIGTEITTTVTDGLASTNTKFESWFEGIDSSVNTFGDFVKDNGKEIKKVQESSVETINSVKDIANETKSITSSIGTVLSNVSGVATDMLSTVTTVYTMNELMTARFDSLSAQVANSQLGLGTLINNSANGITTSLSNVEKNLSDQLGNIPTKLDSLFKAGTLGTASHANDGIFSGLIKAMTRAVISPIEAVKNGIDGLFKVYTNSTAENTSDGVFTKLIKAMTRAVISPVEGIQKGIDGLFKVYTQSINANSSDGIFTGFIKSMTRAVISPIEAVKNGIDSLFGVYSSGVAVNANDGAFTRLIKNLTQSVINPIDTIKSLVADGFKGIEQALKNLDISIPNLSIDFSALESAFNNGWAQLSKDISNLGDTFKIGLQGVLDGLGALFIPSGSNVLDNVQRLGNTVNKKFPIIFAFPSFILGMFTPIQADWFQAIEFSFMGVTTDFTGLSKPLTSTYIPIFRNIVELLLWLTLAIKCWKKVIVGNAVAGGSDDE